MSKNLKFINFSKNGQKSLFLKLPPFFGEK